jgi:Fe(3+) dicitrate transport protein
MSRTLLVSLVAVSLASVVHAGEPPEASDAATPVAMPAESTTEAAADAAEDDSEVIEISDRVITGSAQTVGKKELERYEHNDIHRVLGAVPGVYIREEDGYGLRPNIGMRGSGSERSAKIALLEDGILIAPAPYAAPAAYYFPLITRMERIEVVKGPSAITYGPNTVGGAVNLIGREVPRRRSATLDLAVGQDLYGKLHGSVSESRKHYGVMIEGVKLRSDGFKHVDGGGESGFDKNDLQMRARINSDPVSRIYNQFDVTVGYSDEVSNETYTGLADRDFDSDPYRRYAATQLDQMRWDHLRVHASHKLEVAGSFDVTATVYHHRFSRDWGKLNGFDTTRSLSSILANPSAGNNAVFYAVLTGEADSSSAAETVIVGTNSRNYVSQGLQVEARSERRWLTLDHEVRAGLRYHTDQVDRFHFEEGYQMVRSTLVRDPQVARVTRDSLARAQAWSLFVRDRIRRGKLTVTAGARAEAVETSYADRMSGAATLRDDYLVLIPGIGAHYQIHPGIGVLAGVHKGFVPVAPGSGEGISPEESINYEAGARFSHRGYEGEAIGFYNDYSNLKGTCTFATGCMAGNVDDEFNGGKVRVYGLELSARKAVPVRPGLSAPMRVAYTFNHAEFRTSFSSDNPLWGEVMVGDDVPYLPQHQLAVEAGLQARSWQVSATARHTGRMRDVPGQGSTDSAEVVPRQTVVDLAASYQVGKLGKAYLTASNLLDSATIVSRRPFGARPGMPRLVIVGYKNQF